jgi:hypothetical protein
MASNAEQLDFGANLVPFLSAFPLQPVLSSLDKDE